MNTNFKYSTPLDVSYILDGGALHESLCGKYTEYLKKKHDQTTFSLMATHVVFLQKNNSDLRWKESSSSNLSYLQQTT